MTDDPIDPEEVFRRRYPKGTPHFNLFRRPDGSVHWLAWRRAVGMFRRQRKDQRRLGYGSNGEVPEADK